MNDERLLRARCRVCGASGMFRCHVATEMMFGTRETFEYVECSSCSCLQIAEVPSDLGQYYPPNYYSMRPREEPPAPRGLKAALTSAYADALAIHAGSWSAWLAARLLPEPTDWRDFGGLLVDGGLRSRDDAILDVGCGSSPHRLAAFRRLGFRQVQGVDPFIQQDLTFEGVPVAKKTIFECDGSFAWIMFHHSLEHMEDPVGALRAAARLLRPGGRCLVRIPLSNTWLWRKFGVHWVELDAPRHLYLFAPETLSFAAGQAGLEVLKCTHESAGWEIAWSELYARGIPMRGPDSRPLDDCFTADERARFEAQAQDINRLGIGGRAAFVLQRN